MSENRARYLRSWKILRFLVKLPTAQLFHYKYDLLPPIDGPYLILCNHVTFLDPILLGLASPKQMAYVITETILRGGAFGKFLQRHFSLIVHRKGKAGIQTIRQMLTSLKHGENVAVFPEGNRSFDGRTMPFGESIGKVAKKSGATLITYRLEGGYLSNPRWGKGVRRGKMRGRLVNVYSPEKLSQMTDIQLNAALEEDLREDAYERQRLNPVAYRGKNRAIGIESAVFLCPNCKKIGTMKSSGSRVTCSCGWTAEYDEYGMLNTADGKFTVTQLIDEEKRELSHLMQDSSSEKFFSDEITLQKIGENHEVLSEQLTLLQAENDSLILGEEKLPWEKVEGVAVVGRNLLILHYENAAGEHVHAEAIADASFSALKYLYFWKQRKGEKI